MDCYLNGSKRSSESVAGSRSLSDPWLSPFKKTLKMKPKNEAQKETLKKSNIKHVPPLSCLSTARASGVTFSICSISSLFLCINLANYNICLIVLYNEYYFSYSHYFLYTTDSLRVELWSLELRYFISFPILKFNNTVLESS